VKKATVTDGATLNPVHVVHPNAVYSLATARAALNLKENTLPREVKPGRLRVASRAGRYLILGKWLLEWIEGADGRRKNR
jgi:hypothetical protein